MNRFSAGRRLATQSESTKSGGPGRLVEVLQRSSQGRRHLLIRTCLQAAKSGRRSVQSFGATQSARTTPATAATKLPKPIGTYGNFFNIEVSQFHGRATAAEISTGIAGRNRINRFRRSVVEGFVRFRRPTIGRIDSAKLSTSTAATTTTATTTNLFFVVDEESVGKGRVSNPRAPSRSGVVY